LDRLKTLERKPGEEEEFVHQIRTGSKRLRAFWRLARPGLPETRVHRELRALRKASRSLAAVRERTTVLTTLRRLQAHGDGGLPASASESFRAHAPALSGETAKQARAVEEDLADSLGRLEKLNPEALRPDRVDEALERSYRRARKAFRKADRKAGGSFHLWRKRIKDLWYQLEALRPGTGKAQTVKHGGPRRFRARLDKLQDKLGDLQDLAILEVRMRRSPEEFGGGTARGLRAAVKSERKSLERKTLRLGAKALRRKTGAFSRKIGNCKGR
jgi:CHAD domain-containing protein